MGRCGESDGVVMVFIVSCCDDCRGGCEGSVMVVGVA